MDTPKLRDKNGRSIEVGDVLKVFHFTGARRKRYYMYKQAKGLVHLGDEKHPFMEFSHLGKSGGSYDLHMNGKILTDYEIVQGWDDFEKRPKNLA